MPDDGNRKDSDVHVKKWVDYSTKYGLGYVLSNETCGVFFNDCTKIIFNPATDVFEYIERKGIDKLDCPSYWKISSYP